MAVWIPDPFDRLLRNEEVSAANPRRESVGEIYSRPGQLRPITAQTVDRAPNQPRGAILARLERGTLRP
jgi:hypothetical protein